MDARRYGEFVFDETFSTARRSGGETIVFTRAERLLLSALTGSPHRVLTRSQLLDAISGPGSDTSDRNVDFVINRLRSKLTDSARSPRFIATRYGEGYMWVAVPTATADTLLVIGPVHGLGRAGALEPLAGRLLEGLVERFRAATTSGQDIRLETHYSPTAERTTRAMFNLELSLYPRNSELHCAMVLRRATGGEVVGMSRLVVADAGDVSRAVTKVVDEFRSLIWHQQVRSVVETPAASPPPIYVAMHDAGRLLTASNQSWLESIDRVRAALEANPDDPQTRLMWGLSLYVQVITGTNGEMPPAEEQRAIEDEIEAAALGALPHIADNPMLKLSVAKLLVYLARGYGELAERLAEEAFERSTAFAASFAILGQVRLMRGKLEEGMDLLERALDIAEPGTEFSVYIMVLLCSGKLAAEDFDGLKRLLQSLQEVSPVTQFTVAPFCVLAHEPLSPQNHAALSTLGAERARTLLAFLHMTTVRQYEIRAHQRNVIGGFAHHIVRLYGPDVVPPQVREILEPET